MRTPGCARSCQACVVHIVTFFFLALLPTTGAMALYAGLSFPTTLGGIVCFSGWAALRDQYPGHIHESNKSTRVLMCHGTEDPTVRHAGVVCSGACVDASDADIRCSYTAVWAQVLFSVAKLSLAHLTKHDVNASLIPYAAVLLLHTTVVPRYV